MKFPEVLFMCSIMGFSKKTYTKEELDAMTIIQLREAAAKAGIKDTKALKRDDLTNNILWAQGDYSTGNPTMIDLQKEI